MKTLSVSNRDGEGVQSVRKATLFFFTRKAGEKRIRKIKRRGNGNNNK